MRNKTLNPLTGNFEEFPLVTIDFERRIIEAPYNTSLDDIYTELLTEYDKPHNLCEPFPMRRFNAYTFSMENGYKIRYLNKEIKWQ